MTSLERRFGRWAIPNLSVYLIAAQAIGAALLLTGHANAGDLVLHGGMVRLGEWWRLLSFMMLPKTLSPIWLFFAFYIFYIMGSALEREWGTFRFNLFILCGYLLTIIAALAAPNAAMTNIYFLGAVIMAFATLFPNFELNLFFVFPVKVKWLGWLTVGLYIFMFILGDLGSRLGVATAFANYALFFGAGFLRGAIALRRRTAFVAEYRAAAAQPRHVCSVCGTSDKTDAAMQFRYCSVCKQCFCENHIAEHRH